MQPGMKSSGSTHDPVDHESELTIVPGTPVCIDARYGEIECCLLCGVFLGPDDIKRRRPCHKLRNMLENKWIATDFVWLYAYNVVMQSRPETTIAVCMPCVHWATRSSKRKNKSMLPLDNLIVSSIAPSHIPPADERIQRRVARCIVTCLRFLATETTLPQLPEQAPSSSSSSSPCSLEPRVKCEEVDDASSDTKPRRELVLIRNPYARYLEPSILQALAVGMAKELKTGKPCDVNKTILYHWWADNAHTLFVPNSKIATQLRRNYPDVIAQLYDVVMHDGDETTTALESTNESEPIDV